MEFELLDPYDCAFLAPFYAILHMRVSARTLFEEILNDLHL